MALNEQKIGTYHLADNPQMFEIQRNNTFEFVVTDIDGIRRAGSLPTDNGAAFGNAQEVLRLSVTKAFVPHFEQEVVSIKRGNNTLKYAGVPTFQGGECEFHDFIGAETKDILMAWQSLSYDVETETVGSLRNTNYKKKCYLIEYGPDFEKVRTWILYGVWISKLQDTPYSSEDGNKHLVTASFQYDYAKVDVTG